MLSQLACKNCNWLTESGFEATYYQTSQKIVFVANSIIALLRTDSHFTPKPHVLAWRVVGVLYCGLRCLFSRPSTLVYNTVRFHFSWQCYHIFVVHILAGVAALDSSNLENSVAATPSRQLIHASHDGLVKQLDGNLTCSLLLFTYLCCRDLIA